jgi:hypothetical protein
LSKSEIIKLLRVVFADYARALMAREILQRYKAVDPALRGGAYRESGWTSFDPKAPAYTADQVAAERHRYIGGGI